MAFIQSSKSKLNSEIPEDAFEVSRDKVHNFYSILIKTWKPKTEVWALAYGPGILGAAAGFTGFFVNRYFRRKLRLQNYGFFTTYLPNVVLPAVVTSGFHEIYIQRQVILDPYGCSLCKETRASVLQFLSGIVQPTLLAPISVFMFATRHFTARIPSAIHNRKEFIQFVVTLSRPLKRSMSIILGGNILLAMFITHMEENHFAYIQRAIVQPAIEEEESQTTEC